MATAEKPAIERRAPETPAVRRRLFSVEEYYRMAAAGILAENERVELIEGEIVVMCPIGSPHSGCVNALTHLLVSRVGGDAVVSVQSSVRLSDSSEPEPDLAVLRPRPDFYRSEHPGPADVLWLIEVMASSADYDRGVKLGLYARSGIAEVWLVDLNEELVEAYRAPASEAYTETRTLRRGENLAPGALPGVVLAVDEILG